MKINRRFLLRGAFQGAMTTVALPFLDCFLDGNGAAVAATGHLLPTRFGTYFFGLGLTKQLWIPKVGGLHYETTSQLAPLEPFRAKMNVFSGLRVPLDDNANFQHWAGVAASATGISASKNREFDSKTIDQQIADQISRGARFKSITAAATGDPKHSCSSLGGANMLPADVSPLALYTRLFGEGFLSAAKGGWKPNPETLVQQSVLSAVADSRQSLMRNLGAVDRARMDQYFTSLREAELQMAAELRPPEISVNIAIPDAPAEMDCSNALGSLRRVTPLMAKLGALALATDQSRVFNLSVSAPTSEIFTPGDPLGYHQSTHEEPTDPALGYQPKVAQYNLAVMELFAQMLKELDGVPEGDGTLLDHSLIFAFSDTGFAKNHTLDDIPLMTAGSASGRLKTGYHVAGDNSPVSRVGFTIQKALGLSINSWGKGSLQVKQPYSELLA